MRGPRPGWGSRAFEEKEVTMRSPRPGRRLPVLLVLAALVALLAPAAAFGLSQADTKVTIDQTTGGQATRFTFSTVTPGGETVLGMDFVFPKGTDVSSATVDAVTLVGLNRSDLTVKAVSNGEVLHVIF